jgi:hypothetical protein
MKKYVLAKGFSEGVKDRITLIEVGENYRNSEIKVGESLEVRPMISKDWWVILRVFEDEALEDLKKIIEQIGFRRTCALFECVSINQEPC